MLRSGHQATITTRTGGADVIASGTVIAFGTGADSWISLFVSFADGTSVVVRFEFEDDGTTRDPSLEIPEPTKTEVRLRLLNFKDPVGAGNITPVRLGALDGIPFYVNFRVFQLVGGQKTLQYTFYVRDDEAIEGMTARAQLDALRSLRDPQVKL